MNLINPKVVTVITKCTFNGSGYEYIPLQYLNKQQVNLNSSAECFRSVANRYLKNVEIIATQYEIMC